MAFSYPSPSMRLRKQTLIIFILCVLVVGGVVFYRVPHNQVGLVSQNQLSVQPSVSSVPLVATDADKNGIADWKEQFSGSTTVAIDPFLDKKAASNDTQNLTLTAELGRNFFTQYVNLKQTGLFDDANTVSESMQALVDTAVDSEGPVHYKTGDLKVSYATDAASLEKWTDAVSKSFQTFTWTKNEAMLANESLSRQDPAILKKISPIVTGYTKIITSLRAIPTPDEVSLPMVDLLNALSTLKYGAQSMQSFGTDPLKGAIGVKAFSEGGQSLVRALQDIDLVVAEEGIVFEMNSGLFNTLTRY